MAFNMIILIIQMQFGWTREGDKGHAGSGLAVLLSDMDEGEKDMFVGSHFAGKTFYEVLGNRSENVIIDEEGNGTFFVNSGSLSVWICKE